MEENLTFILSPKRLRFYRREAKRKQSEIADIIGVERTTYVGYEKIDELELPMEIAQAIADFLKVELQFLKKSEKSESDPDVGQDDKEKEYINIHREVWKELKMNNETFRVSLDKLIAAVDRTMDNLSKPRNP